MATFDVFIPAKPGTDSQNVTVRVEATSWLLALRAGMKQIGEQGETLSSIMVENRPDGSVIVKDPSSRRVFKIVPCTSDSATVKNDEEIRKREEEEAHKLREEAERKAHEREEAERQLKEKEKAAREAEEALRRQKAEEAERRRKEEEERLRCEEEEKKKLAARKEAEAAEAARAREEESKRAAEEKRRLEEEEKKLRETAARKAAEASRAEKEARKALKEKKVIEDKARKAAMDAAEGSERTISITMSAVKAGDEIISVEEPKSDFDVNEVLADLFMASMDLMGMEADDAVNLTLDLLMKYIHAEASSIILSDFNSTMSDLYFAAARGKVADKLADIRIPRGRGIVGFSVQNGCSLAVSDVNKNEQFYKVVSQKTGFETRSILCTPIVSNERTLGAIELVNKVGTDRWTQEELNVVEFLAQKIGEHLATFHDAVSLDLK